MTTKETAKTTAELTAFAPASYRGTYEASSGDFAIGGELAADAERGLTRLSGTVRDSEGKTVVVFDSWTDGTELHYNISDIPLDNNATSIVEAILAVEAELKEKVASA